MAGKIKTLVIKGGGMTDEEFIELRNNFVKECMDNALPGDEVAINISFEGEIACAGGYEVFMSPKL